MRTEELFLQNTCKLHEFFQIWAFYKITVKKTILLQCLCLALQKRHVKTLSVHNYRQNFVLDLWQTTCLKNNHRILLSLHIRKLLFQYFSPWYYVHHLCTLIYNCRKDCIKLYKTFYHYKGQKFTNFSEDNDITTNSTNYETEI